MTLKLTIDLETICDQTPGALEAIHADIKPPGQYKKKESIDKWIETEGFNAAITELAKTALSGISGEICSIAYALNEGPVQAITRDLSMSEAELLERFFNQAHDEAISMSQDGPGMPGHYKLQWIAHNTDFDCRYLFQRSIINNIKPKFPIPVDARPGGDSLFCTMKFWSGMYGQKFVSQDNLAKALGLPGKDGVDGSMVGDMWREGRFDEIRKYNISDVETVRAIHKRLTFS